MNGKYSISLDGKVTWDGDEIYITVLFNNMAGLYFDSVRHLQYLRDMELVASEQGTPLKFNRGSIIAMISPDGISVDTHVLNIDV